jgi:hypothetical protein
MCMQCMATAMTAGAAATGGRAWLATHTPSWMTPRRLKGATAAILAIGVIASGTHVAPNSTHTPEPSARSVGVEVPMAGDGGTPAVLTGHQAEAADRSLPAHLVGVEKVQ